MGVDGGGLAREYFTLLMNEVGARYIQNGTFRHDVIALQVLLGASQNVAIICFYLNIQELVYKHIGMLVSIMLVQAGGDIPFQMLSPAVYRYLCGEDPLKINIPIHDVPDGNIKELMERVCTSSFLKCYCYCEIFW